MENKLSPEQAQEFIEQMIMAVLDESGRYIYVSPLWERAIGISAEKVLYRYVWEIMPDTHAETALKSGDVVVGMSVQARGETLFTTYVPILGKQGEVEGLYLYTVINGMREALSIAERIRSLPVGATICHQKEQTNKSGTRYDIENILGESKPIQVLKRRIGIVAKSNSTVLIEGETGTGKELIAHSIHASSSRRAENFVSVNCAAIPGELFESEFFGYAGGAFTGADKRGRKGRFMLANHGSIFLDEVNLLSSAMQPKLLRVLQEMEIDLIGGEKNIPIDVRVIAASSTSLEKMVESGVFREDLYYRLDVVLLEVPPLRERKEDIPLLADHILKQLNRQIGTMVLEYEPDVIHLMMAYNWPGNIREMRNIIESAVNDCDGYVLRKKNMHRLKERLKKQRGGTRNKYGASTLRQARYNMERQMLLDALRSAQGNKKRAAEALGISRPALYDKIKKYGISGI